jgi:hypothetical protein
MDEREKQQERMQEAVQQKKEETQARAEEEKLEEHERPQGDIDPRTKSSGHGQVTADKWNQ